MRRLVLAFLVAGLAAAFAGLPGLVVPEPCTGFEQPGRSDGACPPTCVTCGCCAQAMEPVVVPLPRSPDTPVAIQPSPLLPVADTDPRDILHVPRLPRV